MQRLELGTQCRPRSPVWPGGGGEGCKRKGSPRPARTVTSHHAPISSLRHLFRKCYSSTSGPAGGERLRAGGRPWACGRGERGRSLGQGLGPRRRPGLSSPPRPRPTAPRSPAPQPGDDFFQAEFVSIIELPAPYLKSLAGPPEEQRTARSKSFEFRLSPQIAEQQASVVCRNLVTRCHPPSSFPFRSGQGLSVVCDGIDTGFKQNAEIDISVNK